MLQGLCWKGSMMHFKKIKMHGFKSFAEPVTVEFNKGITCIVGPNGSGKSNISDAIRWVLGEQSPKMLRGGKMEEVIFSGTAGRKSRGMAEVTLIIDNEDRSLPIEYKEVAITRRMFRSGESEYHINGNQCRLRDIRELIMDTGIGVDGYSIIGQGKISEILSNKTESRREIFEEAAGIVMYRTKKAESERKLTSTSANMERVKDIIGEIESRIDTLREDSAKAKEYIKLRDRYKELEINIVLKNIENLESKNKYIKEDMDELSSSIDADILKKNEIENNMAGCSRRSEALETISVETREKLIAAIDELNAVVNKGKVDSEKLAAIESGSVALEKELKQLEIRYESERQNSRDFENSRKDTERRLINVSRQLREKSVRYDIMSEELADIMGQTDRHKSDIFEFSSQISSAKAEISSIQMMQETLDRRRSALLKEKNLGQDSNKETIDRLNKIRSECRELEETLSELEERAADKRKENNEDRQRELLLSKSLEDLRISLGQLSARKKTIEEMENNYEGYNYAVRHVMKAGLAGIHGVVAELIKVPEGYETAMETALGASLQNIVCENDSSAKKAIASLKANRAGRMTFLPLSSIKGRSVRDDRLRSAVGFIGFGSDCIEFDERYRNVMEYLLGRVVIVDNMDNAVNMSKTAAGVRFVTLEGEVINAGGAITGGRYKHKTANILDRKAEILSMEKNIAEKNDKKKEIETLLTNLRKKISAFSEDIHKCEENIMNCERALISKKSEAELAENVLHDIKIGGDKLRRELENIDRENSNSEAMISDLREKIEENNEAIRYAEQAAEEKLWEYNMKKVEFDGINEEITNVRIEVSKCEKDKEHADLMARHIDSSLRELLDDIESRKLRLIELKHEKDDIINGADNAEELTKEKEKEKRRLENYMEEVTEEKATSARELTKLTEEKEALDSRLQSMQTQKYELEIKNAKNETQLDTYKNKLWEEFEISYIQAMDFKSDEFVMSSAVRENREIKNRIKELGEVNIGAIEEYETVRERYDFLTGQQADIQQAMDSLNKIISDMDKTIKTKFKESFDEIVVNFEEKFRELFGGGHAELRLSDENNPLESNIDIVAQPPGKKLQNINLLSGGEKTLTAIALMFAVLKAKPTPFCILDEVEAALDDVNIGRFISCLRKLEGIQFTLVTHQKATMEQADALYGVTMPEKGVSKVLSLSMDDDFEI